MRSVVTIAALALPLVLAGPVAAQEAPADAAPQVAFTPSHLAAAQEVIRLTESDVVFDDILPRLADQTRQLFIQTNPSLTVEIEATVSEAALGLVSRRVELSRTIQEVWARRFTEAELTELAAFFTTPTGKKFVESSPVISALSLGAARQWETSLAGELVEGVRAKMREKGFSL